MRTTENVVLVLRAEDCPIDRRAKRLCHVERLALLTPEEREALDLMTAEYIAIIQEARAAIRTKKAEAANSTERAA